MGLKHISMLQIDYFLAVASHLNFTEAAKSLYTSQPSISKQIALFEREVGVQLFLRTKRSVRLTPAGTVLFKELSGISDRIEGAILKSRQPNLGADSSIAIGCLDAMDTRLFLRKAISDFKSACPGISLSLERHSFKALREKLINGTLDVIFTLSFEVDDSLGILWDSVYKTNTSIVMSTSHPLAAREDLSVSDLKNEDFVFISREESPKGFDSVVSLCMKNGFTPNIVKQLPNIESLLLCVESGLGVFLFDNTVRLYNSENFKVINLQDDFVDAVIAWKKENLNPAVSLFTNMMIKKADT